MAAPAATAQLRQMFDGADTDKDGFIDTVQLQKVLAKQIGLNFSLTSVARLVRIHDADGDDRMSFNEFVKLHSFLNNMGQSFRYFDRDGSGELNRHEVHQALVHSGFELDTPAFEALFKAFDPDRNGQLGLAEYIALAAFLRSASATFTAFDAQQRGEITLDFNMWIYASASCL